MTEAPSHLGPRLKKRVGVFGGAFDPPHYAHQAMAQAALQQLQLDQLCIFPTGDAWHKTRSLSAAHHRIAMSQLAFGHLPKTLIDVRETQRAGPTYTVQTLRELAAEQPQAELFLIIGGDQLAAFTGWQQWQDIVRLAHIVVAQRPGSILSEAQLAPLRAAGASLIELDLTPLAHSATEIRALAAKATAPANMLEHLLSPALARYIEHHQLYSSTPHENT